MKPGSALLVEERAEHSLLNIGFGKANRGVDERVRTLVRDLPVLLLHSVLSGMIAKRNVAWQRWNKLARTVELIGDRRRERPSWAQTAIEDYSVLSSAFLSPSGPGSAPACVAWREVSNQLGAAERHGFRSCSVRSIGCSFPPA
jgi:hypothetical protein